MEVKLNYASYQIIANSFIVKDDNRCILHFSDLCLLWPLFFAIFNMSQKPSVFKSFLYLHWCATASIKFRCVDSLKIKLFQYNNIQKWSFLTHPSIFLPLQCKWFNRFFQAASKSMRNQYTLEAKIGGLNKFNITKAYLMLSS